MYCPKHFEMPESVRDSFIARYPLATLFNTTVGEIAQCPLIYIPEEQVLLGHLANGNPFLKHIQCDTHVKVLFSGNQGYISPNWYDEQKHARDPVSFQHREVPTWNYSTLEVTGIINTLDKQLTLQVLAQQTARYERMVGEDWTLDKLSERQQQAMANAITAIQIKVSTWQGKSKLSQNKSLPMRQSLLSHLQNQSLYSYAALTEDMKLGEGP